MPIRSLRVLAHSTCGGTFAYDQVTENGSCNGGSGAYPGSIAWIREIDALAICVPAVISRLPELVKRVSYPPPFGPNAS